jgi:hypothetical protein
MMNVAVGTSVLVKSIKSGETILCFSTDDNTKFLLASKTKMKIDSSDYIIDCCELSFVNKLCSNSVEFKSTVVTIYVSLA